MKSIVIRKIPEEIKAWYAEQAGNVSMPLETYIRMRLIETARKEMVKSPSVPDEQMFTSYLLPGKPSEK